MCDLMNILAAQTSKRANYPIGRIHREGLREREWYMSGPSCASILCDLNCTQIHISRKFVSKPHYLSGVLFICTATCAKSRNEIPALKK